jgi:hypothetical protein
VNLIGSKFVFVTSFGEVVAGPLVKRYMEDLQYDLDSKSKRTNAYKSAKARYEAVEAAIETIALVCWTCDDTLKTTP